jgi:hypothetical protein
LGSEFAAAGKNSKIKMMKEEDTNVACSSTMRWNAIEALAYLEAPVHVILGK